MREHLVKTKNERYSSAMARQQTDTTARSRRILDSARQHFMRHGIEAARLADIARDADVAVGTIYLRYRGKEDLLAGVLRQIEDGFVAAMEAPAIQSRPWPDRLHLIFRAVIDTALGDPDLAALMALAGYARSDDWRPGDVIRASIARQLCDGIAAGKVDPGCDPELASALAYGMVDGLMTSLGPDLSVRRDEAVRALQTAASRWLTAEHAAPDGRTHDPDGKDAR
jgi:AcrR family transcriptional regulator